MKKRTYAQEITKEYLTRLGISYVSEDGLHIFKKGKELKQRNLKSGKKKYLAVQLYDSEIRKTTPKEERKSSTGQFALCVHVINYV